MRAHRHLGKIWFSLACTLVLIVGTACGGSGGGGGGAPGGSGPLLIQGSKLTDYFFTIDSLELLADGRLKVFYTMIDDGVPLTHDDLDRSPSWLLGFVEVTTTPDSPPTTLSRYQSYILRTVTGQGWPSPARPNAPALASAEQATSDSGGTIDDLGGGSFCYTFATAFPPGFDPDATHVVGAYMSRGDEHPNVHAHFVPSNATTTGNRELMSTDTCNECHHDLGIHGGRRKDVALCVICHTDQTVDPESGNVVEFGVMIHKIHRGAHLNNGYHVVGFRERDHIYDEVEFPQDIRNCTVCHKDGADEDFWKQKPQARMCEACHDDVDTSTGTEHLPGPVPAGDTKCASCHAETMVSEYDITIPGAHVLPYQSTSNPHLTFTITDVASMTPGALPTVTFMVSDDSGPLAGGLGPLDRVAMVFAGPTPDYNEYYSFTLEGFGSVGTLIDLGGGSYSFAPIGFVIPPGATGTWSVGMEARTADISMGPGTNLFNTKFGANNPVVHIDLSNGTMVGGVPGGTPDSRRMIVDEANCAVCHEDVLLHGNLRTDFEYCIMCHNTWTNDSGRRPAWDAVTNPPESVDFRYLIHKLHRGHDLENGYIVWGFGPSEHDFGAHVHYPGELDRCEKCHKDDTWTLPIPGDAEAQVWAVGGDVFGHSVTYPDTSVLPPIRPPITATCLSCHDSAATAAHAILNTIPSPVSDPFDWVESCLTCHGDGAAFDITLYHNADDD